ncbi:MAG: response regulator [Candidatus Omnitrophica bacterium]|nr:response regulator [Candidatus Omnitrophota bacterium]
MLKKVLIIDDDADLVEAITTLLDAKGYDVTSARDGEEGFKKAKADLPDLILLDVMMTRQGEGFDVAAKLRGEPATKDIPIVMVTGIRKEMNLPFGFEPDKEWLPVNAVLEKPVKPEVLLKVVEENIRK